MYLNFEVKMFINSGLKITCVLYYTMFLPFKLFILKLKNLKKNIQILLFFIDIFSLNLVRITICLNNMFIILLKFKNINCGDLKFV